MTPAAELLLDETDTMVATTWLVLGGEEALVQGIAADPTRQVIWQPVDIREAAAFGNGFGHVQAQPVEASGDPVDVAILPVPPDRSLARRWLLVVRERLVPGGLLLLAGANAEGIRSVIADATAIFGSPESERYGQKQRIAQFRKQPDVMAADPAWATTPGIAPGTWEPFTVDCGGESLPLVTRAGVFAGAQLDAGTRLLLESLPDAIAGSVLDLGCGAGVIGIVAASRGATSVVMSDANLLAVATARENVQRLGLSSCEVVAGDVYTGVVTQRFDLIVSNPPFHRGKAVDFSVADRLIEKAPEHLAPGGSLLVVANAFLAYGKRMERAFRHVETVAATRQFHLLRASEPR